jgi:hypothetical protein
MPPPWRTQGQAERPNREAERDEAETSWTTTVCLLVAFDGAVYIQV